MCFVMNIEIANRLVEMRKEKGFSQEALAEQLGISRQAVSKWERAESSPDTSNLIMLAKLYNVSLDELLNTDQDRFESGDPISDRKKTSIAKDHDAEAKTDYFSIGWNGIHYKEGDEEVHIGWKGIHYKDGDKETFKLGADYNEDDPWYENMYFGVFIDGYENYNWKIDAFLSLVAVCIYVWVGFEYSVWHPGWLILLTVPIVTTLIQAIKSKNANLFAYPVLVTLAYLYLGFVEAIWHPTWLAFVTIPLYYIVIDKLKRKKVL